MWNKIVRRMSRREMAVLGLLLSVCFLTCGLMQFFSWGQTQLGTGELLCADTLRFHIRAESDSLLDQSIKLYVRDAILAYTDAFCTSADKPDALRWAARNLPQFQLTAQQVLASLGLHSPVRVRLVNMYFNQTRYQSSALPAGRYDAVRIDLGDENHYGKNWWCVLYPGLCRSACGGYALPEENDLVCGEYIVRFKLVDWWQSVTADRKDEVLVE